MLRRLPIVLLAALLAASSLGAASTDPAEVPAAARTTVQLLDAGLTQPDGSVERAQLGELRLVSKRDGTPWAGMDLVGAAIAGRQVADWSTTTDDGADQSGDANPDLPQAPGVAADLALLDYVVRARGTEATSALSTVRGELGLAPLSLRVDNAGPALATSVGEASDSTTSLALGTVELTLGDLLPPGLLDELPLGVVIALLEQLPVSVPTVEDLLTLVEEIVTDLTAVVDADAALDTARAELNELVGDAPGVVAAEETVAAAEATLEEAMASLKVAVAEREAARTALVEAKAQLADALAAELDDAIDDTTGTVDDSVDDTTDTVDGTTDETTDAVDDTTGGATDGTTDTVDGTVDDTTGTVNDAVDGLTGAGAATDGTVTPMVAAALLTVAEAEQLVAAAQAELDDARKAVTEARVVVDDAEQAVADATRVLDDVVDEAATTLGGEAIEVRERIIRVSGEMASLLDRLTNRAASLPDLSALLDALRAGLVDVPVVSLGGVSLDIALDANASGATAQVACSLDHVTVFGQTLTDPSCGEASDLLATVPDVVADLLAVLPLDELPVPRIAGLVISTETSEAPSDGATWARARVTGLALEVPSVSLAGLADDLTGRIDGLLADALAAARGLAAATDVAAAAKSFSVTSVVSSLSDLQAQLDGLPIGGQLDGLRTVGLDVTVGHLAGEVIHGATAEGPLEIGDPYQSAAPAPDPVAAAPAPDPDGSGDAGAPSLPVTGGGLGLLSLALMGGALLLRRRPVG